MSSIPNVALPGFQTLLGELIAAPSISSPNAKWDQSNEPVIRRLSDWFESLGFAVQVLDVPDHPGKYNLIASLGQGEGGLVLSGHTDTVPFDQARWHSDPFTLTERDHRFYGLGTCDMKGFFAIIIEALRALEGAQLSQPLIVLATADEESSMSGARAIARSSGLKARAAVIGEPTSLRPVRMHKGILMEHISVTGQAGHSSNPALGNSALEGMHHVMAALLAFRMQLQSRYTNTFFEVPFPTLNLGHVHGGDSPNRICGHCELSFDLRPLPGMHLESLREEIRALAVSLEKQWGVKISIRSLIGGVEPFETSQDAEIVRLCERLTGQSAQAVAFATEAPFLDAMGMETIVMGAGSIDQAHQPDEFLALDQIEPMSLVLQKLIKHYCVLPA